MLWIILAAMTGLSAFILLWPLARARNAAASAPDDAAFYRSALADIDRDLARGLIGPSEAAAAKIEAGRRLLRSEDRGSASKRASPHDRRVLASLIALIAVPAIALSVYVATGSPQLPDQPLAARRASDPSSVSIADAVARIEAHLAQNPSDGAGYDVVAPVYFRLGRVADAVRAFSNALRLNGETPERLANLGEALVAQADGIVTAEARERLARADALGFNAKARFYLALAKEQDGDKAGAIAALDALMTASPADAPWLPAVREKVAALRGAPAGGETIAALPEAERNAAIRGMVDGLAQRLATNGGSIDEWSRLVRSHMSLGDRDKAARALASARKALAPDAAAPLDALSREFGL